MSDEGDSDRVLFFCRVYYTREAPEYIEVRMGQFSRGAVYRIETLKHVFPVIADTSILLGIPNPVCAPVVSSRTVRIAHFPGTEFPLENCAQGNQTDAETCALRTVRGGVCVPGGN